jgi:hypothetical protein
MSLRGVVCAAVLVTCAACVVAIDRGLLGPDVDPARMSGAAVDTCFDCKDMLCNSCPSSVPCHESLGYCYETVRSVSRWCAPKPDGLYLHCKWRVDPAGSCVTQLLNPCTPEHVSCTTENSRCGPLGICIAEGVCPH